MILRKWTGRVAMVAALSAVCIAAPVTRAQALEVGDRAPAFALPDQDGKVRRLSDYRGKWVVLAFYPKDFTGG